MGIDESLGESAVPADTPVYVDMLGIQRVSLPDLYHAPSHRHAILL